MKKLIYEMPTQTGEYILIGMYLIAPMLRLQFWSCVDAEDDEEETSGDRSSLLYVCYDLLINFVVVLVQFSFT